MKRALGLLLLAAILFVVAGFVIAYAPRVSTMKEGESSPASQLQLTVGQYHDESANYTIQAQYPQFGIPAIDVQIKQAVERAVAEFKTYPPNPPDSVVTQNEFNGTFDKVYAGSDIVSAELVLSQYTGGAHPFTLYSGLNYDRATGRALTLEDALALIGLTVEQVSQRSSAQFETQFGDAFFREGADTNPENFSSFTISADKVTFIFQQYQVAAYAAGMQEVSFSRVR